MAGLWTWAVATVSGNDPSNDRNLPIAHIFCIPRGGAFEGLRWTRQLDILNWEINSVRLPLNGSRNYISCACIYCGISCSKNRNNLMEFVSKSELTETYIESRNIEWNWPAIDQWRNRSGHKNVRKRHLRTYLCYGVSSINIQITNAIRWVLNAEERARKLTASHVHTLAVGTGANLLPVFDDRAHHYNCLHRRISYIYTNKTKWAIGECVRSCIFSNDSSSRYRFHSFARRCLLVQTNRAYVLSIFKSVVWSPSNCARDDFEAHGSEWGSNSYSPLSYTFLWTGTNFAFVSNRRDAGRVCVAWMHGCRIYLVAALKLVSRLVWTVSSQRVNSLFLHKKKEKNLAVTEELVDSIINKTSYYCTNCVSATLAVGLLLKRLFFSQCSLCAHRAGIVCRRWLSSAISFPCRYK